MDVLEELIELRSDFAIGHAIQGFGMSYDEAMDLIRNYSEDLSATEKEQRNALIAAVDNLVDFSAGAEYQMAMDLPDDEPDSEEAEDVFYKYNYTYANTENLDISYAMMVAAGIIKIPGSSMLMFMTQGDERVRPWHLQYEGFTETKSNFPHWLIPPIEHRCRCYLDETMNISAISNVVAQKNITPPDWFNPVFKESVAFGGRIFSDEHSYFNVEKHHVTKLKEISKKIKQKYFNNGQKD